MSVDSNAATMKPSPVDGMKRTGSGNLKCTYCGKIFASQMHMVDFYQQHVDQHKYQIKLQNERDERQRESRRYAMQRLLNR